MATPRRVRTVKREFDAAMFGGHAANWRGSSPDANSEIRLGMGLSALRWKSRDLYNNNPYAGAMIDRFVDGLVGTGIFPGVDTGNKALDELAYDIWERWGEVAVPGVKGTIYTLQRDLVKQRLVEGNSFARIKPVVVEKMPGLPPVKIQPLESDLLCFDKNEVLANGNRIVNGIELDGDDEIVAYHMFKTHPGSSWQFQTGTTFGEDTRVPIDKMIHSFARNRVGALLGVPMLTRVMLALWNLAGYTDSVRIAARAAATMVGVVTDPSDNEQRAPLTDGNVTATDTDGDGEADTYIPDPAVDANGNQVEEFSSGAIIYLNGGRTMETIKADTPLNIKDFISANLHEIAAAEGISYHTLSGDMSDANFSQAKLGLIREATNLKVQRALDINPQISTPLWQTCMFYAYRAGLLDEARPTAKQIKKLMRPTWSDPVQPAADRLDEAKAANLELAAGLRSRQEIIESNYGRDADKVNAEIAADKIARDGYGIICIWDASQVSTSGILQLTESDNSSSK